MNTQHHYPILITQITNSEHFTPSYKFKTEKSNWELFENLTKNFDYHPEENLENTIQALQQYILNAATQSIPMSTGRKRKPPLPWWNSDCQRVLIQRKRAERALKRNHTLANKIAYKRCKAECRQTFNKARRDSWTEYVSSINTNTDSNIIWKKNFFTLF